MVDPQDAQEQGRHSEGDEQQGNEYTPLLREASYSDGETGSGEAYDERGGGGARDTVSAGHPVPARIARRLYVSHILSTWNSRLFEFGAVLYLAGIFPGTLFPLSVYAFTRGAAGIFFAPAVGQYIDTGNRLQVVRVSIMTQRWAVATSCAIFFLLGRDTFTHAAGKSGMLALLAFLACVEKLSSILNMVSVEKDWVVVVAEKDTQALRFMNAQMRRIDLLCKLLGPLFIALIVSVSTEIAIIVNFAMNAASVFIEYFAISRVYHEVPALWETKGKRSDDQGAVLPCREEGRIVHNWRHVEACAWKSVMDFKLYYQHPAFLPSIAGALLYLTVLNFGGQMVTYLLSAGYNSTMIGFARTFSVAFEVLATWVGPWLMGRIGPVRAGLWLSTCQVVPLIAGLIIFWTFFTCQPLVSASGLIIGTIVSRLGLRGFDLSVQVIVQEEVEAENRGAFSSVEAAWQNAFELLSYASTMIFARPDQFKYPTLISVLAISTASFAYTIFARIRRGHIMHLNALSKRFKTNKGKQIEQERVVESITSRDNF